MSEDEDLLLRRILALLVQEVDKYVLKWQIDDFQVGAYYRDNSFATRDISKLIR
jgi:hypothetical protein